MGIENGLIDVDNKKRYEFGKLPIIQDVFYFIVEGAMSIYQIIEFVDNELKWIDREQVESLGNILTQLFKHSNTIWYLHDGEFISTKDKDNILIDHIDTLGITLDEFYNEFEKINVNL